MVVGVVDKVTVVVVEGTPNPMTYEVTTLMLNDVPNPITNEEEGQTG